MLHQLIDLSDHAPGLIKAWSYRMFSHVSSDGKSRITMMQLLAAL